WLARHRVVTQRILRALAPSRSRNETNEPRAQMSAAEIALAAGVDEGLCLQLLRNLRRSSPLLSTVEIPGQGRQFQLAHDYLVPIVRQWSDRRLGATLWGRTEALLTDRAEAWQASASRPLPSFGEWAQLLLFGRRVPWGPQSQRMMRAATVRYAGSIALALLVLVSGFMIWSRWDRNRTLQQAVLELAHARTEQVPGLVADQPATTRPGVAARITRRLAAMPSRDASSEQLKTELNLSLALLGLEGSPHVEAAARLIGAIPDPEVEQWPAPPSLQSAYSLMAPHVAAIRDLLQQVVNDPEAASRHRRRAAGLLAQAAIPPEQWLTSTVRKRLVADLIEVSPVYVNEWIQIMQPVGGELLAEWCDVLARPDEATAITRALFASAYADPSQQLELLTEALPMQIPIIAQAIGKDRRDLLWEAFQSTALPPAPMVPEVDVLSAEQALVTCEGTAAASGAIAQAIPLDAFPEIQASLASCKYHLDTLRPYERNGRLWCAATWLPGVRETAYMVGLSAEEARELVEQWSPQHHASDLTNYGDVQQARLAMVWHRKLQTDLPQDISINLTREEHESRALTRQQTRFLSTRISVTVSPQGEERYSEIWEQFPREHADYRGPKVIPGTEDWNHSHLLRDRQLVFPITIEGSALSYLDTLLHFGASRNMFIYELGLAGYEEMLAGDLLAHAWGYQFYRPGEAMDVLRRQQMDVISASAWSDTTDRTSQVFSYRSTTEHARACREALNQGQIPASISVRCSPDEVALASVWHAYVIPEGTIREVASRHVHYALGLANLDQWEALREVLRGDHGRMAASYAVHWIQGAQTTSERFISQIQPHDDDRLTYYSLLALAELDDGQTRAVARCLESIQSDEANVRSAIAYCGRRRGVSVEQTGDDSLASKLGIEMIRVDRPPAPLFIGGACWQEEFASGNQSQRRPTSLANDFELSATEITVAAFRTFADSERIRKHYHDTLERYPPLSERSRGAAQYRVTFFDAAMFCQWLSEEAGVPVEEQCYPGIWDVAEGTYVAPADMLSRSGYRLPLETEFEIACRAGSQASRHYGPDLALLPAYAWIATNSDNDAHLVGWKRPNEFGFFDMLGNVDEWCHNTSGNYYEQHFKRPLALTLTAYRLLRGGDFKDIGDARPDYSKGARPKYRNRLVGFRIARTCAE
ncbi:MAG: formylglycine-generating enzyme family protein, partial [Planctomycetota bacterium]